MKLVAIPCKPDCQERDPYCHGSCPKYDEYNKYNEFIRAERYKISKVNYDISGLSRSRNRKNDGRMKKGTGEYR